MSLLKEGDGINFQRASYTLDGCVKIYTSRVDSVATETGKLLSGLSENKSRDAEIDDENEDADQMGEEAEGEAKKKTRRARRAEATLHTNFEQQQLKKLELELSIDPLFRKMCADFDEGGAKGLLLNSLVVDKTGRVVFDGEIDDENDEENEDNIEAKEEQDASASNNDTVIPDIRALGARFFPDLDGIDSLEVCPSLPSLNHALADPALGTAGLVKDLADMSLGTAGGLGLQLGEGAQDDWNDDGGVDAILDADLVAAGGEDDGNLSFGDPNLTTGQIAPTVEGATASFVPSRDQDLLAYFDETLRKNWAGPEHWKVQRLKGVVPDGQSDTDAAPKKRTPAAKKQETFIDFFTDDGEVDESIFADGGSATMLPKTQWKSKNKNLLPDDTHFSSKNLIRLFLRPNSTFVPSRLSNNNNNNNSGRDLQSNAVGGDAEVDENFWANQYQQPAERGATYDADFFLGGQSDGPAAYDDPDPYEDHGEYAPTIDQPAESSLLRDKLAFASKNARPEYVNYARTAKRVNVKLLKNNIWNVLDMETAKEEARQAAEAEEQQPKSQEPVTMEKQMGHERKFTEVVKNLRSIYSAHQLADISTSFCFICLLHLANEKGLTIQDNDRFDDLTIKWDARASETDAQEA